MQITWPNFRIALINDLKIKYNFEKFMIKTQKLVEAGRALEGKTEIKNQREDHLVEAVLHSTISILTFMETKIA